MDVDALLDQLAADGVADHLLSYPREGVEGFTPVEFLKEDEGSSTCHAKQLELKRDVILKVRRAVPGVKPTSREAMAFRGQAELQVTVPSERIVQVHSVSQASGFDVLVLEYVPGKQTLRVWQGLHREKERNGQYFRAVASIAADVCEALEEVHGKGVVHCDIKPDNILIAPNGKPKLADFGAARRPNDPEAVAVELGTLGYMSPEHVEDRGNGLEYRSDIYSMGAVLHELLTFSTPTAGHSRREVAERMARPELRDPRAVASSVPDGLAVVCMKALAQRPQERYQSAKELREELQRYLDGKPVQAEDAGLWRRARLAARRHPGVAAALVLGWSLLVVSVWFAVRIRTESDARLAAEKSVTSEYAARLAVEQALTAEKLLGDVYEVGGRLSSLEVYSQELWPVSAVKAALYEDWLRAAEELRMDLEGAPGGSPGHRPLKQLLDSEAAVASVNAAYDVDLSGADLEEWSRTLDDQIARLDAFFDEDTGLAGPGIAKHQGSWGMERRLARAQELAQSFGKGGAYAQRWDACIASLREYSVYAEFAEELPISEGLVPIGQDPASRLWEFWHVLSGDEPARGEDGKLVITKDTGLVFVLLPGGAFRMGAQNEERLQPNYDPWVVISSAGPVHDVELSPFFLSKYEMTQQQWTRLTGTNPSRWHVGISQVGDAHPLENMSREELDTVLWRFGLDLPTEAQWEYGARGGTTSTWWPGNYRDDLWGVASIADRTAKENGGDWPALDDWPSFEDGFAVHAPVDAMEPNGFGLHGIHGNVEEHCRDAFMGPAYQGRENGIRDPFVGSSFSKMWSVRDGSWDDAARDATIAGRRGVMPYERHMQVGVRPAIEIDWD